MAKKNSRKLSSADLASLKKLLLTRREMLVSDVDHMENGALKKSRQASSGDVSSMPTHLADIGTDTFEQQFTIDLLQNEAEELRQIDAALDRMTQKAFGLCEDCGGPIKKDRLRAIPYTHLCIECKRAEETLVD